jgi:WD40 repeat protein
VSTGAPLRELVGHTGEVTAAAAPPGVSNTLYSASVDGTLRLWDADSGDCLRTLDAPGGVEAIVFAPGAPLHARDVAWHARACGAARCAQNERAACASEGLRRRLMLRRPACSSFPCAAPSPLAFLSCRKPGSDVGRVVCYNLAKGKAVDTCAPTRARTHAHTQRRLFPRRLPPLSPPRAR